MKFGKRFKYYRRKSGLTQNEAANKIGIKGYQLGNYETDRSEPSLSVLMKMSNLYHVSIDNLLGNRKQYSGELTNYTGNSDNDFDFDEFKNALDELIKRYQNR